MRITSFVALSWRLGRPRGYMATIRALAITVTALLFTLSVLLLASASSIVEKQQHVIDDRTAVEPTMIEPNTSRLLTANYDDTWNGLEVHRVLIAGGDRFPEPHPPGIPRNPRSEEVFVSASYLDAIATHEALDTAIAGYDIAGIIDRTGLRDPREIRIIQGATVPATAGAPMTTTLAFGDDVQESPREVQFIGPLAFFLPLVLTITFLPLMLALILTTRLMANETDRRFAVLQAIGIRRRTCRLIAAAEVMPAAICGALVAVLVFESVWRRSTSLPGTDFSFWAEDTAIPAWVTATAASVCVVAVIITSSVAATAAPDTSTRPQRIARTPRWWWFTPTLAAFAIYFTTILVVPNSSENAKQLAVLSAGILLLSLTFTFSATLAGVSAFLARNARTGRTLIGARWAGERRGSTFKLATAFSTILFVAFVAVPFAAALDVEPTLGEQGLRATDGYNLYVSNTRADLSSVASSNEVRTWLPYYEAESSTGDVIVLISASCRQLAGLSGRGCRETSQLIDTRDSNIETIVVPDRLRLSDRTAINIGSVTEQMYVPLGQSFQGAIKVTRPIVGVQPTGYIANLRNAGPALETFKSRLANTAPTAIATNDYTMLVEQSNSLSRYLQFLGCGAIAGLASLLIALTAALMRSIRDRQNGMSAIHLLGASPNEQRAASLMAQTIPVLVCSSVACAAAAVFVLGLSQVFPATPMPMSYFVALAAAAPVVTFVSAMAGIPLLRAR